MFAGRARRALLAWTAVVLAAGAPVRGTTPNIVLFLVDDLGWQDTSVPFHETATPFNERDHTPHLERLAAEGMRFTNAYASAPVCTPTRTSLMTGQSPGQTRITFWTLHRDRDTSANRHPTLDPPLWNMNGLNANAVTLPALLRGAGYTTIHVGKAHFGAHGTHAADPRAIGFDVNIAGHASGGPASFYGTHHFTVAGRQGKPPGSASSVWDIPGLEKYHGQDIYLTEALAIEAIGAMRAAVAEGRPFFLYFAPYAVHAPIMANTKYAARYAELPKREAAYATMIETVDAALGSIMAELETLGVAENTVIVYASDNGGLSAHARGPAPDGATAHTHNAPLRSGKGSAYEGGVRVPTVVKWPGRVDTGTVCDVPIVSHDFFPTIVAMSGATLPITAPDGEGRDLTPLLDQHLDDFDTGRDLFWHQPHQWGAPGPGIEPYTSIRRGRWKLIYFHAGGRLELFDLERDIGEQHDLAAGHPELVAELATAMDAWFQRTGAQRSIDKATGTVVPAPGAAAAAAPRP